MPRRGNVRPGPVITEPCWYCQGTKTVRIPGGSVQVCPRCDGTGRLPMLHQPRLPGETD